MLFSRSRSMGTRSKLALCYAALMVDGFDLVTNGFIAPRVAPEFSMGSDDLGILFGLTSFGMLAGAVGGGMLGDRYGPKWGLLQALLVFGMASLLSALATDVTMLVAMRVCTGIGIGAALPNVLSYVATLYPSERSGGVGTVMTSAVPIGGGAAGLLVFLSPSDLSWQAIVSIGGLLPLAVAIPIALLLPNAVRAAHAIGGKSSLADLFTHERKWVTPMLWLASFLMMTIFYTLVNWLPTFFGDMGLAKRHAGLMMLVFTYTGALSAIVFGLLLQKRDRTEKMALIGFCGTAAGALGLYLAGPGMAGIAVAAFFASAFSSGAQCLLLGLSPTVYPPQLRGSGAGAAIAAGRLGAIVGPMSAGFVLASGGTHDTVFLLIIPVTMAALFATLKVVKPAPAQPDHTTLATDMAVHTNGGERLSSAKP